MSVRGQQRNGDCGISDEHTRWVTIDPANPEHQGGIDREQFDNPVPDDLEDPYPVTDEATIAATLAEFAELGRRKALKRA